MVRHSYIHTGAKPYSCEFCQSTFTSTTELKRHTRLHAARETCQGQQLGFVSGRKRTLRPLKNYTCDECNIVFYTRGHLSFHKKFHEQRKAAAAAGYTNQSNEYHESKICKVDGDSQDHISLSLSGKVNDCLTGGTLASVDFEQAGDAWDNKKMCSGKKFPENSHGINSLPVVGRSEVHLNSYRMDTVICKEEPLFSSKAPRSQVQDDDAYQRFVENLRDTWPSSLSAFKTYRCQRCNYATAVHSDFKLHLKIHTDERPFACNECNKTFKTNLELHVRTHTGEKPYSCSVCQKKFRTSSHLKRHRVLHFDVEHLKCRNCDYSTNKWLSLKQHLASHSCEESTSAGCLYEQKQLPVKTYTCEECGYSTAHNGNLKPHLRIHTGEKPFKCEQCAVAFRTSSHLKRHLLTHLKLQCRR
ncbi:PREDICTED: zinc finger protein 420-like, partial [Leptosomus discolor]|uniref:zinc finger protein 420-like n=1 Tax=Leptosomus discolor TaxID=188344 RepID=UPI000522AB57